MKPVVINNSLDDEYYQKVLQEFPDTYSNLNIQQDYTFVELNDSQPTDELDNSNEQSKVTKEYTQSESPTLKFLDINSYSEQQIRNYLQMYSGIICGEDTGTSETFLTDIHYQSLYDLQSTYLLIIFLFVTIGLLIDLQSISWIALFLIGIVTVRYYIHQSYRNYLETIHHKNQSCLSQLYNEYNRFQKLIKKGMELVTEIELVAKGYRLALPRAPIARIEVQQSQSSFHTIHIRKLLSSSLSDISKRSLETLDHLQLHCPEYDIQLSTEDESDDLIENSIIKLKHLEQIVGDRKELLLHNVWKICEILSVKQVDSNRAKGISYITHYMLILTTFRILHVTFYEWINSCFIKATETT
jgi:hypothetical protein